MVQPDKEALGGFWIRFVARVIDSCIVFVPSFLTSVIGRAVLGQGSQAKILDSVMSVALIVLYYVVLQSMMEGTPGKYAVGYRLVRADGGHVGFGAAFLRYVVLMVGACCAGLGVMWVGWDQKKQGWHDHATRTLVVRREFVARMRAPQPALLEDNVTELRPAA